MIKVYSKMIAVKPEIRDILWAYERDHDMPVLRLGVVNGIKGWHKISSNDITNYYKAKLDQFGWQMLDWSSDPTYNLNRKGRDKRW